MNTAGKKKIYLYPEITIEELRGKYAWNKNWNTGGYIEYGNGNGVAIGGCWYSTITGDCLYDSLVINGFEVFETE